MQFVSWLASLRHLVGRNDTSTREIDELPVLIEQLEERTLLSGDGFVDANVIEGLLDSTTFSDSQDFTDQFDTADVGEATSESPESDHVNHHQSVVFVDSAVDGYEELIDSIRLDQRDGIQINIHLLDSKIDGISQVGDALNNYAGVDSIHVISHGNSSGFQLGATWIDGQSIRNSQSELQQWSTNLSEGADLLIYGCNLAASASGKSLLDSIGSLTGTDVAASDDPTGAANLGGDWELEYNRGKISTHAVSPEYHGLLVIESTVEVVGGNLVVNDSNGGNTADDLTFTADGTNLTITDNNGDEIDLLGSLNGGTGDGTSTVTVALTSFTGGTLDINSLAGDDDIRVGTLTLLAGQNLDIDVGTGSGTNEQDKVFVTGGVSTAGGNISITANDVDLTGTLNAGTGDVTFLNAQSNDIFLLAAVGTNNGIDLHNSELSNITAANLIIGGNGNNFGVDVGGLVATSTQNISGTLTMNANVHVAFFAADSAFGTTLVANSKQNVLLKNNIFSTGKSITLNSDSDGNNSGIVELQGNVIVDSTNGGAVPAGANISVPKTIDADSAANNRNLTLNAGTAGTVSIGKTVGFTKSLNNLSITGTSATLNGGKIAGALSFNSGTGTIVQNGSTLQVNGTSSNDFQVNSGATLGGTGAISGNVDVQGGGTLAPGQSPGILATGDLDLMNSSTLAIEVGGTSAGNTNSDHDQVNVTGTVTIGSNVTLNASSFNSFTPTEGNSFTIINNDSNDAVSGTFNGLAEGATISNFLGSGLTASISYVGGSGNDVVLSIPNSATPFVILSNQNGLNLTDANAARNINARVLSEILLDSLFDPLKALDVEFFALIDDTRLHLFDENGDSLLEQSIHLITRDTVFTPSSIYAQVFGESVLSDGPAFMEAVPGVAQEGSFSSAIPAPPVSIVSSTNASTPDASSVAANASSPSASTGNGNGGTGSTPGVGANASGTGDAAGSSGDGAGSATRGGLGGGSSNTETGDGAPADGVSDEQSLWVVAAEAGRVPDETMRISDALRDLDNVTLTEGKRAQILVGVRSEEINTLLEKTREVREILRQFGRWLGEVTSDLVNDLNSDSSGN